jgi:hypothetical protein
VEEFLDALSQNEALVNGASLVSREVIYELSTILASSNIQRSHKVDSTSQYGGAMTYDPNEKGTP